MPTEKNHLRVDVTHQIVELIQGNQAIWSASVSTAKNGLGEEAGSHRTPRGWFVIGEKIGGDSPFGTVFKSRKPTGEIWKQSDAPSEEDLILTRILWLEGLETANANTRERFIYFHGTNQEHQIGTPLSHGCIRLKNDAIIELFDLVEIGTKVWIG